jgi:hypothetical protein
LHTFIFSLSLSLALFIPSFTFFLFLPNDKSGFYAAEKWGYFELRSADKSAFGPNLSVVFMAEIAGCRRKMGDERTITVT